MHQCLIADKGEQRRHAMHSAPACNAVCTQRWSESPLSCPEKVIFSSFFCVAHMLASTGTTLLGFIGTPWTLAAYSVEGKADKDCKETKVSRQCMHADCTLFFNFNLKLVPLPLTHKLLSVPWQGHVIAWDDRLSVHLMLFACLQLPENHAQQP